MVPKFKAIILKNRNHPALSLCVFCRLFRLEMVDLKGILVDGG